MFLFHSIWNYNEVRKVVPDGPAVTLVRDPVDMFESGYAYFNNIPKVCCWNEIAYEIIKVNQ